MTSAPARSELAAELPALVLFFATGIVGCLVAKWISQYLVLPQKSAAKSLKSCEVDEEEFREKEANTASAREVELSSKESKEREKRARRRQRSALSVHAKADVEKAHCVEPASPINEHISTAPAEGRASTASSAGARGGSMAAKRARRSQQRSKAKAELDNMRYETEARHELGTGNVQPSAPSESESRRGTDSACSTMADSCSDGRSLDCKRFDSSEESDTLECSPQCRPEEHTMEPCEPITAALQKLQQQLSEVSAIKHRVEGSVHLGLNSPANENIKEAPSHAEMGHAFSQEKHGYTADSQQCGEICESRPKPPHESDEEDSDEDDEKYDEALRAILDRAQGAEWQSTASLSGAIAAPTWSPESGHTAWAHQLAPSAPETLPDQPDMAILPAPTGANTGAQPLVPCPSDPGFYTDGQQVYHPVYVKVDPDAGSVLDPQVHAVVECDDPEYMAYLNYINACQSVVVMAQAPGSDRACPQLALVPNTPHAKTQTCNDGDCWNMSWDEATSNF